MSANDGQHANREPWPNHSVHRPELIPATEGQDVPTTDLLASIAHPVSRAQVQTLRRTCDEFGITLYSAEHSGCKGRRTGSRAEPAMPCRRPSAGRRAGLRRRTVARARHPGVLGLRLRTVDPSRFGDTFKGNSLKATLLAELVVQRLEDELAGDPSRRPSWLPVARPR